jgi:hypothetical protein
MSTILFGNNKGGVGKDLGAAGAYHAALARGLPMPTLIELETRPRLAQLYPEAVTIPVDVPSPETLYANPDSAYAALDKAGELWAQASLSITSLGANMTSAVLAWSASQGPRKVLNRPDVVFCVMLTMNRHAMAAGLEALFDIGEILPEAKRVAILNDVHAAFMEGDQFLAKRLEEARGNGTPIEVLRLPRCAAPAWGYAQNLGTLEQIANLEPEALIKLGLPEGPVRRSLPIIAAWISDSLIGPMGTLLPAETASKRQKSK